MRKVTGKKDKEEVMPSPEKQIPDRTMFQPMRFVNMPNGKQNGFATFHITQSEAHEQYEFSKNSIPNDFFLETCNPPANGCSDKHYPDEYPDNYTYLQLISDPKEREAKTKPKLLPVELIELLKSYISTQPGRSNPSDNSVQEHRLCEYEKFTESIQKSNNEYLKTILNADPEYQNMAIMPAFLNVFSKQIVLLINLLMSYSLEETPSIINKIVKGMYALIDQIDVNYAGNQYKTHKQHPEEPYQERKNLNLKNYVYKTYYNQLNIRKEWLECSDINGELTFISLSKHTDEFPILKKAVSSLTDHSIVLSPEEIQSTRQQYLDFLYKYHIDETTKNAARKFQDIYKSVTISEADRRQLEVDKAMITMKDAFSWLSPPIGNTICTIDRDFTAKTWDRFMKALDTMWEFPRLNELFRIIGSDIAERFFPVINTFVTFSDIVSSPTSSQTAKTNAFYDFNRAVKKGRYKNSCYYTKLACECKDLKKLVLEKNQDGRVYLKIFLTIWSDFLQMLYTNSITAEYSARPKENLGYWDIDTIISTPSKTQDNQKTSSKKNEFKEEFFVQIKHSIMGEILQYTYY